MDLFQKLINDIYFVKDKIGEGGTGVVYLVEYRKTKENYALKAIQYGSSDTADSFKHEVSILKKITHENIVKLIDSGYDKKLKVFYIVTEYIYGTDIKKYCHQRTARLVNKLTLFAKLCDVIKFVHSKGIVHRDIKPSNILVTNEEVSQIKLLDFGVSKLFDTLTHGKTLNNNFTKAYMAPEQIERSGVSEQTDVYQLGITFIELLSEEDDFRNFINNCDKAFIIQKIQNRYSIQDTENFLSRILNRCTLAKKEDRYENLQILKNDLNDLIDLISEKISVELFIVGSVVDRILKECACNNRSEVAPFLEKIFQEEDVYINFNPVADNPHFDISLHTCSFKAKVSDENSCFIVWGVKCSQDVYTFENGTPVKAEWIINTGKSPRHNGSKLISLIENVKNYRKLNQIEVDNKRKERSYLEKTKKHMAVEDDILNESIQERNYTTYVISDDKKTLTVKIKKDEKLISEKYIGESFLITSKVNGQDFETLEKFEKVDYEGHSLLFGINPLEKMQDKIKDEGTIRIDNDFKRIILNKEMKGVKTLQFGDSEIPDLLSKILNPDKFSKKSEVSEVNFISQKLDNSQRNAVKKILSMNMGEFFVLQGPPGTGKTTVITEIVQQILRQDPEAKILISSQSNQAVDKVLIELHERDPKLKMVRIGNPERIKNDFIKELILENVTEKWMDEFLKEIDKNSDEKKKSEEVLKVQNDWKKLLKGKSEEFEGFILKFVEVIGATCVGIASKIGKMHELRFDWVIVDEAGRATFQELAIPISRGSKILLVGDHKQLPPFVDQEVATRIYKKHNISKEEMETSLFEELFNKLQNLGNYDYFDYLANQYRMHPEIGEIVSQLFYEGKIKSPLDPDLKKHYLSFLPKSLYWFSTSKIPTKSEQKQNLSDSWYNPTNAKVILKLLEQIEEEYSINDSIVSCQVGIITPYTDQVNYLKKRKIKPNDPKWKKLKIDIATLDSFQGDERDIIIYDVVRSNPKKQLGFITDARRLNVALSRARKLLVIIGDHDCAYNGKTKNEKNPYIELIDYMDKLQAIKYME